MTLDLRPAAPTTEELTVRVETPCRHHGCVQLDTENVLTVASGITLARTAGCLASVLASVATGKVPLLFLGLAVHCVGDMADGIVARRRDTETRAGAVLDIVCDRLCVAAYYFSYGHLHHDMLVPIGVFLFSFMVLDSHLSLAFLSWPLRSLNYFYLVDRALYRWNWSPTGKAFNSGALVALMLTTRSPAVCTVFALGIGAVKVASLVRLYRTGVPAPTGCAMTGDAILASLASPHGDDTGLRKVTPSVPTAPPQHCGDLAMPSARILHQPRDSRVLCGPLKLEGQQPPMPEHDDSEGVK